MIEASCHCGAVLLQAAAPPKAVTECNCSICRRTGALWAYYRRSEVRLPAAGATDTYSWDDRSIAFHRCRTCGCLSHWAPTDPGLDRIGLNARLLEPGLLAAARVRRLDGAATGEYVDD